MKASAWITWAAQPKGENGVVVPAIDPNWMVEVMFGDGVQTKSQARFVRWEKDAEYGEVVAYRVVWEW